MGLGRGQAGKGGGRERQKMAPGRDGTAARNGRPWPQLAARKWPQLAARSCRQIFECVEKAVVGKWPQLFSNIYCFPS